MSMKTITVLFLSLAACAEAEEARLDRAQILAVRSEPAHVAPGEKARIDILAGDESGAVYETDPETLVAIGDQGPLAVEDTPDGWFVTAGATPDIANLVVTLTIDGLEWPATKVLVINEHAENPGVAMAIDGAQATEMIAQVGTKPELTAVPSGREPFTFAWYSSVGDLELYRQPTAVLDAATRTEGTLLLVVRDNVGGVNWQVLPARVE